MDDDPVKLSRSQANVLDLVRYGWGEIGVISGDLYVHGRRVGHETRVPTTTARILFDKKLIRRTRKPAGILREVVELTELGARSLRARCTMGCGPDPDIHSADCPY